MEAPAAAGRQTRSAARTSGGEDLVRGSTPRKPCGASRAGLERPLAASLLIAALARVLPGRTRGPGQAPGERPAASYQGLQSLRA